MLRCVSFAVASLFVAALAQESVDVTAPLKLRKMLVVSRHGIRVPFAPAGGADIYSRDGREWFDDFKQWGASGEAFLTDHGKLVIKRMGDYYRHQWVSETGLLEGSCESLLDEVTIYADYDETGRDIETAKAFFKGFFPDCASSVVINCDPNYVVPLFNQGQLNFTKNCGPPPKEVIESLFGGNATTLSTDERDPIRELSDSIGCCKPAVCQQDLSPIAKVYNRTESAAQRRRRLLSENTYYQKDTCTLNEIKTSWKGQFFDYYNGPLFTAASLTEYLQLLYLNGMDYTKTTSLDPFRLARLVDLHQREMDLQENFWATQAFGSELLGHIQATMDQLLFAQDNPRLLSKSSNKFVYYAAHDINIYFLRNFFRLNWRTRSFNQNQAMPGGMLVFELLEGAQGQFFVKVFFMSASYDQQRYAEDMTPPFAPPDRVFTAIPGCAQGPEFSCPYANFKAIVQEVIRPECTAFNASSPSGFS